MTDPVKDPASVNATDGLLGWMLQYMRPYSRRIALLSVLLVSEIGLGALAPWPLAIVIDYVLGRKPFPDWALPWIPEARPGPDGVWWLVPAPSRRRTSRQRGGAHMTKLARWCAAELARAGHGVAVAPMLELASSATDSVGLDPAARAANLAGRVRLRPRASPPPGTPVVLLDDVITTGATAAACHQALTAAGLEVTAIVTLTSTD